MPSLHTRGCLPAARWFKPLCTNYHTDIIRLYLTFSVTLSTAPLWAASTASYLKNTESCIQRKHDRHWQFPRLKGSICYFLSLIQPSGLVEDGLTKTVMYSFVDTIYLREPKSIWIKLKCSFNHKTYFFSQSIHSFLKPRAVSFIHL